MSFDFGKIPSLTTELAALDHLKNGPHHFSTVAIDPILFKLVGNEVMHTLFTVAIVPVLLNLQALWPWINSLRTLNFRKIRPLTMQLAALECL